jgi:uncharacterized protein
MANARQTRRTACELPPSTERGVKYTICVTHQCNLRCGYCYISKHEGVMSLPTAGRVVDFAFAQTPADEKIEIGFFGGEPLLAFDRVRDMVTMVEDHPQFARSRVEMTVVSNGTVFSDAIADLIRDHDLGFGISCDGPPDVQDTFRRFCDGRGTGKVVEGVLRDAMLALPRLMVNAVYHPRTFRELPRVVAYFSELGLRQIYLTPDLTASWTAADAAILPDLYDRIRAFFVQKHRASDPHFISLLDGKIAVILNGGYQPCDRCRMGRGEYAFTLDGYIYPCERLIGEGGGAGHCIGHIETGVDLGRMVGHPAARGEQPDSCRQCGVRDYCMHWCGCSNFMSTGSYQQPGPFLCASERAAIESALAALEELRLEQAGLAFLQHFSGEFSRGMFQPQPSSGKGGVAPMAQ